MSDDRDFMVPCNSCRGWIRFLNGEAQPHTHLKVAKMVNSADLEEARQLAYQVATLQSKYTRAFGVDGQVSNGDRVADLISGDSSELGTKLLEVLKRMGA